MPPRVGLGPLPANDEYKAFGSAPSAEESPDEVELDQAAGPAAPRDETK